MISRFCSLMTATCIVMFAASARAEDLAPISPSFSTTNVRVGAGTCAPIKKMKLKEILNDYLGCSMDTLMSNSGMIPDFVGDTGTGKTYTFLGRKALSILGYSTDNACKMQFLTDKDGMIYQYNLKKASGTLADMLAGGGNSLCKKMLLGK